MITCAFYSYKGGVGRTMALANIAEFCYQAGLKVLMIDWDLEAPGLERFFPIEKGDVTDRPGLMDMLLEYKKRMAQRPSNNDDQKLPFAKIASFVVDIYPNSAATGRLLFLSAGRRSQEYFSEYANTILTFDWRDFYENWEGELFFEWLRKQFKEEFDTDIVLIDSRTGVTEIGGICIYQMADVIVMLTASNDQNLEGTDLMAHEFTRPTVKERRGDRPLEVVVVPARLELTEGDKLNRFKENFLRVAAKVSKSTRSILKKEMLWDLGIPYIPYYAFEEKIAIKERNEAIAEPMVRSFEKLARALARIAPNDSPLKQAFGSDYAFDATYAPLISDYSYDAFISYSQNDYEWVSNWLIPNLERSGLKVGTDLEVFDLGKPVLMSLKRAVSNSRFNLLVLTPEWIENEWPKLEAIIATSENSDSFRARILPILLRPCTLPPLVANLAYANFSINPNDGGEFSKLVDALHGAPRLPETERSNLIAQHEIGQLTSLKEGLHMWTEADLRRYHGLREKFVSLSRVFDHWLTSEPQKRGQRIRVLWLQGEEGEYRHDALMACLSGLSRDRPPVYDAGMDLDLLSRALKELLFSKGYLKPPLISVELSADEYGTAWTDVRNALISAENHFAEDYWAYPLLIVAGTGEQAQQAWQILQERMEIKIIDTNGLDLERPYSFHGVHGMDSATVYGENIFNRGLPITTRKLFGREEELETLTQAWHSRRCRILSLVAYGGIGKSALVNTWLSQMRDQNYLGAQKVLAWSFYSQGTKENLVSADLFVNQAITWLDPNEPIPLNSWAKGQTLARLIKKHRLLLVLDGLEPLQHPLSAPGVGGQLTDDSIRALLEELSDPEEWRGLCVITTRVPLTDLHRFEDGNQKEMGRVVQLELENLSIRDGADLLRDLIRTPARQRDLEKAAEEVQGHALAITLMGNYLRDVHQGNLEGRFDLEKLTVAERDGGHARRIMASYERWLQANQQVSELALLHVIGLFDRPAPPEAMSALLAGGEINLFPAELDRVGGEAWNRCVGALRQMGLLNKENPDWPGTLDAHPLVREHFRDELLAGGGQRWVEGNRRLYVYYRDTAPPQPTDSKGMNALYAAVTHGCAAGLYQRVFDELLLSRVWRDRRTNYSTRLLGMTGSDLVALSNYFQHRQWTQLQDRPLSEPARILILTNAGVRLRQLGRLVEARQCFGAVVHEIESIPTEAQESQDASYAATQYCELLVIAGKLAGADDDLDTAWVNGQRAIEFADRGNEPYFRMHARSSLGEVYFMLGDLEKANVLFEEARRIDQEYHPNPPFLYSQSLFRYGYYLIEAGRAKELLADAQKSEAWGTNGNDSSLLSRAIRSLILGAAHRAVIESGKRTPAFIDETEKILNDSIVEFRTAGYADYTVRGLLERACFYRIRHFSEDYRKTLEDLDQATFEAQRGQMELLYADILLQRLACYLDFWPTMSNADRVDTRDRVAKTLMEATNLIEKLHYHRRSEMLTALQKVAVQQGVVDEPFDLSNRGTHP